ncbi:MAG: hypothetical protein AVDCRST_MAG55-2439 [uncultured Rubrobacteraceae bacterium]|uniref:Uncharacterized protein n=1 Tax=uncultured Rubrobacteraceae bacterium TaxID=349277 RepID=A0A6J4Q166_9ACTN|nr:MAG: hypothetical protein AVDCRST_MAG55-2439 [uncultured Rubrobacteraceae bacterium]
MWDPARRPAPAGLARRAEGSDLRPRAGDLRRVEDAFWDAWDVRAATSNGSSGLRRTKTPIPRCGSWRRTVRRSRPPYSARRWPGRGGWMSWTLGARGGVGDWSPRCRCGTLLASTVDAESLRWGSVWTPGARRGLAALRAGRDARREQLRRLPDAAAAGGRRFYGGIGAVTAFPSGLGAVNIRPVCRGSFGAHPTVASRLGRVVER